MQFWKTIHLLLPAILLTAIVQLATTAAASSSNNTKEIGVVEFSFIDSLMSVPNDTLYVLNFWATWCKPCIEEMPYFEQAAVEFKEKPIKIIFISLDFANKLETVRKFAERRDIKSPIFLLRQGNPNEWIDDVAPEWSGAIPATVFARGGKKVDFYEGEMTYQQLAGLINGNIIGNK